MSISGGRTIKPTPDRTRKFIRIIFQLLIVLGVLAGLALKEIHSLRA